MAYYHTPSRASDWRISAYWKIVLFIIISITDLLHRNQGFWRDPTQDKKFFIDGQIGRYKQGVQVVSKNEITAVKSSRGKRSGRTSKIKF